MAEAVRAGIRHAGLLVYRRHGARDVANHRALRSVATPEEIGAVRALGPTRQRQQFQRGFQIRGNGQLHRLAVLGGAHQNLTMADPVAAEGRHVRNPQCGVAQQQRDRAGAEPFIRPLPDDIASRDDFRDFVRFIGFPRRRLQILRHRYVFGDVVDGPSILQTEAEEMPEDLQFLYPGPRADLSRRPERVDHLQLDLVDRFRARRDRVILEKGQASTPVAPGALGNVLMRLVVRGDRVRNRARVPRAAAALDPLGASGLCARPQPEGRIFHASELPHRPCPVARIEAFRNPLAVDHAVVPDRAGAFDESAPLVQVRAALQMPAIQRQHSALP
ncbi:MAG TPA: hypothetical protein VMB85_16750 [Bryobacteraceae bacterium]|nr:hypothetical protein [Bryobacteraceae bacterium]